MRTVHHASENAAGVFARGLGGSRRPAAVPGGVAGCGRWQRTWKGGRSCLLGSTRTSGSAVSRKSTVLRTRRTPATIKSLYSIALDNGQVVTAGILRSDIVTPASPVMPWLLRGSRPAAHSTTPLARAVSRRSPRPWEARLTTPTRISIPTSRSSRADRSTSRRSSRQPPRARATRSWSRSLLPAARSTASFGTSGVALIPVASGYSLDIAHRDDPRDGPRA